ncbi:hypothetical protein GCM10027569_83600 [Flindersiella endophytica]
MRVGQVGLTDSTFNYNQGTFGAGDTADTLYVRLATSDRNLYAVDVNTRTTTRIALTANVPNISDMVWASGYLWGVYGEGNRLYRINPANAVVPRGAGGTCADAGACATPVAITRPGGTQPPAPAPGRRLPDAGSSALALAALALLLLVSGSFLPWRTSRRLLLRR